MEWKKYPANKPNEGEEVLACCQFIRECDGEHIIDYYVAAFVKARFNKKRRWAFVDPIGWASEGRVWRFCNVTHWARIEAPARVEQPPEDHALLNLVDVVTRHPSWSDSKRK
jgi:hypothetical protein